MSRSSNNRAKGPVFLALLVLLLAAPVGAQTPNPPGGGSGGGGTGCTTAGSNGDLLTDDGAGGCNSDGSGTLNAGALALGSSGVLGSVIFGNATSGTVTVEPVTGALGTVTLSLPAATDTLVGKATIDTLTNKTLTSPVLDGTVTGTGVSTSAAASKLVKTDANSNAFVNNLLGNVTLTVGSGGTTTLTAGSAKYQALSTAAQTYVLPDATTLSLGPWFVFNNNSSGTLTINKNGGTALAAVPAGGVSQCGPTDIGTAAGGWDCHSYLPSTVSWGTSGDIQVNNVLSTTPGISTGASSSTSPAFKPQRGTANTGYSGDATHLYGVVGGALVWTLDATGMNLPTGHTYQVNGTNISTTVNGQNCAIGGSCTITASAGSVTVGTTTVTSGTTGAILYDNAGTLGNQTTGTGILTWLGTPSSANLRAAVTDETGTGLAYFQGGDIGTPSAGVGSNLTSLNASNLASGTVAAARGGAGTIIGALKGNGSGVVSQAACADLSDSGTGCTATSPTNTSCTAALTFSTSTTGLTQTTTCQYAKFGALQVVTVNVVVTNIGSASGNASITVSGPTNENSSTSASCSMLITSMTLTGSPQSLIGPSSTTILLRQQTSGANSVLTNTNFSSSTSITLTCPMVTN